MALGVGDIDVNATPGMMRGMSQANALSKQALENKYYGPKTMAQVASQMSYANAVGPQVLAKLMGNDKALASLQPGQPENIGQTLYNVGTGQQVTPEIAAVMKIMQQQQQNPIARLLQNLPIVGGMFGGGNNNQQPQFGQQTQQQSMQQPGGQQPAMPNQNQAVPNRPRMNEPIIPVPTDQTPKKDYFTTGGEAEGREVQGKERGKIRAEDMQKLGDQYQGAIQKQDTFNEINRIIASPEYEKIRQLPAADKHELLYYKRYGNKAQQNMVGRFETLIGNVIRDGAQDFKGQFRKGEQTLLEGMKINTADTVDSARGKAEALNYLNAMLRDRTKYTYNFMKNQHMDKADAMEAADRLMNGDEVREKIHDQLNPTVTIKNKKTGEIITIPAAEARKKYGVMSNV